MCTFGYFSITTLLHAQQMPEEVTLDYAEITSIPPLPLWTLLEADKEMLAQQNEEKKVCY